MGDRNNPIKFGPEWLRNLSLERNAGTSNNNSPNQSGPPNFTNSPTISGNMQSSPSGNIASGSSASNTPNIPQNTLAKVLLAKQRFGREEMLALYDKEAEAPPELKQIDVLYQARGKPPIALNNTFEDEMRDNMRSGPSTSGMPPAERFTMSRGGTGRGLNISEGRGRAKLPFIRQVSNVRGGTWHHGTPRMPVYSGGPDEESTLNLRSSWNSSNGGNAAVPNSSDQHWNTPSKMFRSKRQGTPANWRQSREDGEEWRLPDGARSRSTQQEQNKWERDWGDRPQDKQQSWSSNRRTWVGGDTQNDENLPEWAMDNAEACGGTFDSSGAFHGYSNDDSNLPKNQETSFLRGSAPPKIIVLSPRLPSICIKALTRSHTHGSFVISKTTEDNSDEWWASEKAKKLSPKRFDASDIKFKKQTSTSEASESSIDPKASTSKEEEISEKDDPTTSLEPHDTSTSICDDEKGKKNTYQSKFSRLESMEMLSDMSFGESGDEKGNFQSVIIITPNNILRQKHQNIVSVASEVSKNFESNLSREKQGILHLLQNSPSSQTLENEMRKHQSSEDKIVDDIFEMSLDDKETTIKQQKRIPSPLNHSSANLSAAMPSMVNSLPQLPTPGMQLRLSSPAFPTQGLISTKQNIPTSGMPVGMPSGMQGLPAGLQVGMQLPAGLQIGALPPSLQQVTGMQPLGMPPTALQVGNQQSGLQGTSLQPSGMHQSSIPGNIPTPGMQGGLQNSGLPSGLQVSMQPSMQPVGITNSALNASLGLPIVNNAIGIPLPGVPPPVLGNSAINSGMGGSNMQGGMGVGMQTSNTGLPSFQPGGIPGMSNANVANSSLFLGQNTNNPTMGNSNNNNIGMPNHAQQSNIFPMHGLQHSGSQAAFGSSIYSNMMQQAPNQPPPSSQNVNDQWYYEDPSKNIQGPFLAKDMYNWYRAGFFSPSLMVRRACDSHMRPLGSYGPVVPFAQRDVLSSFSMSSGFDRPVGPHESILNSQPSLGLDSVMNVPNLNDAPTRDSIQFGSVGLIRHPPFPQQQPMVDSLWSQPSPELWMQQALNARNESRVNNIFFWDHQPSNIASNTLLPEDITKEMKTEDQILAQLRASQAISSPQNIPFLNEQPPVCPPTNQLEETFSPSPIAASNLEELQKLLNKDALVIKPYAESITENAEVQQSKTEKITNVESPENITSQAKAVADFKPTKQSKTDNEKTSKNKENNNSKTKNKKKEEKKDDVESKIKEDDNVKTEKRSEESSPTKNKKEDKLNKKDLEKEKKEWLKEGFTIVKGPEKNASKDNKKKAEEAKVAEEVERKRKEDERLAAEEEKKRKQTEALRKQEIQQQKLQQRQAAESVVKKAPWSVVANQAMMATSKDGLTLTEIQKLEREKKLEQIKEQQQMMQIIAQQQAAALAREQEMQASLGWAKKKGTNLNTPGQSLNEIQAEARKQAALSAAIAAEAAAAAAVTQALDDGAPPPAVHIPWSNAPNGSYRLSSTKSLNSQPEYIDFANNSTPLEKPSGFWDTQPNQSPKMEKSQESPKAADAKIKKKVPVIIPPKKETTPAAEFDNWCNTVLASWSSKIDVPTFVAFLKDIESPYEVKDYVKCYLGESKDSNDFSRHFLERRSKLLRAGTVTPSDDLCSPAMAINPRTSSNSDYQEVKGKGKKTKKNKMLKVDARILGFSVTASEDRINVGDIDTV